MKSTRLFHNGVTISVLFGTLIFLLFQALSPALSLGQPAAPQSYAGKLRDGQTDYNILVPKNWNGTVFASLDTIAEPNNRKWEFELRDWLMDRGYATVGTARGPSSWNLTYAATNIIEALDKVEFHTKRKPSRAIVWGRSRGGITSRVALQLFPERFSAGIPMCGGGGGTIAMWNYKLDAAFVLDVLAGPEYGVKLELNNITNLTTETDKINSIVNKAKTTPQGRARMALAAAFSQIPVWNDPGQTEPAKDDYEAQMTNVASQLGFALGTVFIPFMEKLAGGPFTWNHGVDYQAQLSRSGFEQMVRDLYKKAGLDLNADLDKLAKAPRKSADPKAVGFIEKRNMTWTGKLQQPVFDLTTTGDPSGPISDENSYADIVRYAGNGNLLRQAFVHRGGHCNFNGGEVIAVFATVLKRLDTGKWEDDLNADKLNKLAKEQQAQIPGNSGVPNFVQVEAPRALRTWDVRNWDTYSPQMK